MKKKIVLITMFVIFVIISSITKIDTKAEGKEDTEKEEKLEWFEEWKHEGERDGDRTAALEYQENWACHFLVPIDLGYSLDTYEFRNLSNEGVWKEENTADFGYMQHAYIADIVVDKYIREYGGEDIEYVVECKEGEFGDVKGMDYMEIKADNIKLKVIWGNYSSIASVLIHQERETAETRSLEYITYLQQMNENARKIGEIKNNKFGLIIDAELSENVHYRNLQPQKVIGSHKDDKDSERDGYIADTVIDRYIRDYKGSDAIYELQKTKNFLEGNILTAKYGDETLIIKYKEDSWLVNVEVQKSEMDLGVVSQQDIDKVAKLNNIKVLHIAYVDENIDLTPLSKLEKLEELEIVVNSESKEMDLSFLSELKKLKRFYVYGGHGDWSVLANLKQLESLEISNSEIETLSFLRELTELKELTLGCVADTDMNKLNKLSKLESLYLQGNNIRNVDCLKDMKNITYLYLLNAESDVCKRKSISAEIFSEMKHLNQLYLIRINIVDTNWLSTLPSMEKMVLVESGIDSIKCLSCLSNLRELEIYGESNEQIQEEAKLYFSDLESMVVRDEVPGIYDFFNE